MPVTSSRKNLIGSTARVDTFPLELVVNGGTKTPIYIYNYIYSIYKYGFPETNIAPKNKNYGFQ